VEPSSNRVESLYRTWWDVVETSFRLLLPAQAPSAPDPRVEEEEREKLAGASPETRPALQALQLMRRLLTLYSGAPFASFGSAQGVHDWQVWARQNADQWKGLLQGAGAPQSPPAPGSMYDALDRTFSGLADSLGMGPSRAMRDALRELLAAEAQRRNAQLAYFAVFEAAWRRIIDDIGSRVGELQARGEPVDSFLALVRLWAGLADRRVHEVMQSEQGLKASAEYIRAVTRVRVQLHRVVAIASEALNVPTRAELDDAYLEIQQLKRQMRELKRASKARARPRTKKASRE
jgi:poly(hydroxyalkanoate) synthase III subunit E